MHHAIPLPHEQDSVFLTDGGIETSLIFLQGYELPHFAAFHLLQNEQGRRALAQYYRSYLDIACRFQVPFVLESPTWRASRDWVKKLGYGKDGVSVVNARAVQLMHELKTEYEKKLPAIFISGCIGPRGDGYRVATRMTSTQAAAYHAEQVYALAQSDVDLITAITMNYPAEATGIANAAATLGIPAVISFTVETNGRLPDGTALSEAIDAVDNSALTKPAYYMINCAHPNHFIGVLKKDAPWMHRIQGIRANASEKSHAELDESISLDRGNVHALAQAYAELKTMLPHIRVLGGCCGTDHEHLAAIAETCIGKKDLLEA